MKKEEKKVIPFQYLQQVLTRDEYLFLWRIKRLVEKYIIINNSCDEMAEEKFLFWVFKYVKKYIIFILISVIIAATIYYFITNNIHTTLMAAYFFLIVIASLIILILYLMIMALGIRIAIMFFLFIFRIISVLFNFEKIYEKLPLVIFFESKIMKLKHDSKRKDIIKEIKGVKNKIDLMSLVNKMDKEFYGMDRIKKKEYEKVFEQAIRCINFAENISRGNITAAEYSIGMLVI